MTVSLRFFLPDGFNTKSEYGAEAYAILAAIGERKRLSTISICGLMGQPLPGIMFELTEDITVTLDGGSRTMVLRNGELMLYAGESQTSH